MKNRFAFFLFSAAMCACSDPITSRAGYYTSSYPVCIFSSGYNLVYQRYNEYSSENHNDVIDSIRDENIIGILMSLDDARHRQEDDSMLFVPFGSDESSIIVDGEKATLPVYKIDEVSPKECVALRFSWFVQVYRKVS